MSPVRVVLAAMPRLLDEIVRESLAAQPGLEVLADVAERGDLAPAVARTAADVAVVAAAPSDAPDVWRALAGELLAAHPRLRLVAITCDGRAAYLYELVPREAVLWELSPRALADAIRRPHPTM